MLLLALQMTVVLFMRMHEMIRHCPAGPALSFLRVIHLNYKAAPFAVAQLIDITSLAALPYQCSGSCIGMTAYGTIASPY